MMNLEKSPIYLWLLILSGLQSVQEIPESAIEFCGAFEVREMRRAF
jgi:hypothetical protein